MGYESKLYIVEKTHVVDRYGKKWGDVVAMLDLSKYYNLSDVLRNKSKTDCYIIAEDGNTEINLDRYGDELTESDLKTVIDIMEKDVAEGENYRRIFPALSMLKTLEEQKKAGIWGDLVVLHYGY